jgi:hypothetical protein
MLSQARDRASEIELLLPGGLEGYFQRLSTLFQGGRCPLPSAVAALAQEFGLDVDPQAPAEICARFGLTLG